jgi:hypothetical protein
MMTGNVSRAGANRSPLSWKSALPFLAAIALLSGCAAGKTSLPEFDVLAQDLAACLPDPPEGWNAGPMEINAKLTKLKEGKIDAAREYTEVGGKAEMEIGIRTSRWCCWVVTFSGDLEKLEIQGHKACLDPKKNKALLYVSLTPGSVVTFEADNMTDAAQAVVDFAAITNFDCLKKHLRMK